MDCEAQDTRCPSNFTGHHFMLFSSILSRRDIRQAQIETFRRHFISPYRCLQSTIRSYWGRMTGHSRRTLYVGNLPGDTCAREVEDIFYKYGPIVDIDLKIPPRPAGYALVEFEDYRDAEEAVRYRDGYDFYGHPLRVEFSHGGGYGRGFSSSNSCSDGGRGVPDFLIPTSTDMEEKLKDLEMSQDELEGAAARRGIRDASLHIGENLDKSELPENLGDSHEVPNSPLINETSEWTESFTPRVEKSLKKNTCASIEPPHPVRKTEAQRVDDWALHAGRYLGREARNMLISVLQEYPEAGETGLLLALFGWDFRDQQNEIEEKKILQETQELLSTYLTAQKNFEREVSLFITRSNEGLKEFQSTIRMCKELLQEAGVAEIGRTSKKTPSLPTPQSSSNKAKAPAETQRVCPEDLIKDMVKLMEMIKMMCCSAEELTEVLTKLVTGMAEKDSAGLETIPGKMLMMKTSVEDVKKHSLGTKKLIHLYISNKNKLKNKP